MNDFSTKLRSIMTDKKMTAEKISKLMGVSTSTVTHWSNGRRFPKNEELIKGLSEALGVSTTYFFEDDEKKPVSKIQVVGTASCGAAEANMNYENSRTCYYNGEYYKDSLYCVIANGDSMSPEIEDGDEIICDPDVEPQHGDIVHYTIDGESAVKVYVKDEEAYLIQFIPYNSNEHFKTKTVRLDDTETMDRLKISKVVAVNKLKFNNRSSRLRLIGRA